MPVQLSQTEMHPIQVRRTPRRTKKIQGQSKVFELCVYFSCSDAISFSRIDCAERNIHVLLGKMLLYATGISAKMSAMQHAKNKNTLNATGINAKSCSCKKKKKKTFKMLLVGCRGSVCYGKAHKVLRLSPLLIMPVMEKFPLQRKEKSSSTLTEEKKIDPLKTANKNPFKNTLFFNSAGRNGSLEASACKSSAMCCRITELKLHSCLREQSPSAEKPRPLRIPLGRGD